MLWMILRQRLDYLGQISNQVSNRGSPIAGKLSTYLSECWSNWLSDKYVMNHLQIEIARYRTNYLHIFRVLQQLVIMQEQSLADLGKITQISFLVSEYLDIRNPMLWTNIKQTLRDLGQVTYRFLSFEVIGNCGESLKSIKMLNINDFEILPITSLLNDTSFSFFHVLLRS